MSSPPDLSKLRLNREEVSESGDRRSRLPWIVGAVAVAALAVLAWLVAAPRPVEVQMGTAQATGGGTLTGEGISANGYVVARTKASVSAQIIGRMVYLGVSEGSRVRRGQILARIQSADTRAALAAARAEVERVEAEREQARRDLARARSLRERNVISETELENARTRSGVLAAQLAESRARADVASANYENTLVRAPFDGTVLRKDAEVGEIVAPSSAGGGLTRTAIVTMADLRTLEVEVDVNEAYIAQIRGGQPARILLDAYPDTAFSGRVRQVVPTADRQKATVQVKVSILDRDPRILPEMGAKVVFEHSAGAAAAAAPRRVLIPKQSVVQGSEGARVWLVEKGRVRSQTVETGAERGNQIEIRRGLDGGETVVIDPPARLREGTRVRAASG